jgi:hypothetical protein
VPWFLRTKARCYTLGVFFGFCLGVLWAHPTFAGQWDTYDWEFPTFDTPIIVHVETPEFIHDMVVAEAGEPAEGWTYVGAMKLLDGECHVWVPPLDGSDNVVEIWRHEFRHCTGWEHPPFVDIPETEEEGLRIILKPGLPKLRLPPEPEDAIPGQY